MILYVGDGCPKCKIAEKEANENVSIQLAENNIEKFKTHHISTVPVLELDDGTWITNFAGIMKYLKGEN